MPPSDEDALRVADTEQVIPMSEVTEEQLLQKLMSEDETEKYPAIRHSTPSSKITRPLVETTNVMTDIQPTLQEVIEEQENSTAPIAIIKKEEEPTVIMRETKNKPQRQYNWLQRLLATIWQTIP
jgi:hypothetical protein